MNTFALNRSHVSRRWRSSLVVGLAAGLLGGLGLQQLGPIELTARAQTAPQSSARVQTLPQSKTKETNGMAARKRNIAPLAGQAVKPTHTARRARVKAAAQRDTISALPEEITAKSAAQARDAAQGVPQVVGIGPTVSNLSSATPFRGDLRALPPNKPVQRERPARKAPGQE